MSIFCYTSTPEDYPKADKVFAIAVNHKWNADMSESICGHKAGWPDKSMTELLPECKAAGCRVGYQVESYRGRVVQERERNYYDDSDFEARVVTDLEALETKWVLWGTTRGWTYFNGCTVDAPEDLIARVREQDQKRAEAYREALAKEKAELDAKVPTVGKRVRVISKRSKLPFGFEGTVVWFGISKYARTYTAARIGNADHPAHNLSSYRVGIRNGSDKVVYAAATVVEIVEVL